MDPNIKAVRYYDGGYRMGILVHDDERESHIIRLTVAKEIRVKKYRIDLAEVVTEYLDADILASLSAKILELGKRYGMTQEARKYLV